jgi:CubicO group peptidase (beta-lactamase class C family)
VNARPPGRRVRLTLRRVAGVALAFGIAVTSATTASVVMPVESQSSSGGPPGLDRLRSAAADIPRLHSLLVSWRGDLILEHYRKGIRADRPANVKSVSKSVISALVGIALERRLIDSLETPIARYFPQLADDLDQRKRKIRIEDLLTMRSGLESTSFDNYGSWVRSRNWVQFVLDRPMIVEPGTTVEYSTGSTHLLSAILTKVSKTTTHQFAQSALGTPLGITFARWPRDPQGIYFGGNEMLLTPRQMVRFGELYLRDGRWKGQQIVPARWIETSCVPRGRSRFNPDQGYGYGWWSRPFGGHDSCFAWGFGGQYIFLFRDLDLVVVTTSAHDVSDDRRDHRRMIFDILEQQIVPDFAARMPR